MTNLACGCPPGWRYHALNCPTYPGQVSNRRLDEKATKDERRWASFRRALQEPGAVHIAATALVGKTAAALSEHGIEPTDDKRENIRLHMETHGLISVPRGQHSPYD